MSELLTSLRARREAANCYIFNEKMWIEINLLDAQIKAIEKRKIYIKGFEALLNEFEERAISNANSGGGHPDDIVPKKEDYKEIKLELLSYLNNL